MIQYLNVFFYDIYPYICATVFFLGSWLRYDYGQYTWRASSSQMLDKRGMVIWSNLFHIGILGIFFGHLFGMLTPHWMYAWFLPIAVKQQMAMILGGVCGVLTLIGGAGLLWRRLTNQRVRATSTTPDIIIMSIFADSVPAWPEHHSVFGAISGWQRNDEVGGLGAKYCHLPRRVVGNADRRGVCFPCPSGAGDDYFPALPVHPSGSCLERAV
ncbi:nitrate reductase 2 subunit gamma [Salmonella enterica]|nr:nitrate reductase 2 subunit gamma [Salmonella enterica]